MHPDQRPASDARVSRRCPVCESDQAAQYLTKGSLQLVRCDNCSMVYANPVPAAFASGEAYEHIGSEYYLSPAKLQSDYAPVRFRRELDWFRRYCKRGAVLDVGCSSGAFLYQLERLYPGEYRRLGTDASGPALEYAASQGVPVARGDFLSREFAEAPFDALTFWAVLEHVAQPRAFLERAFELLRPGGLCLVLVPNMDSLAVRLLGARYRYIYPQHLNYFSSRTLLRLLGPKFEVVALGSTHFNPMVIWQDWRRGGAEVTNAERAQLLQRTTAYKQKRLLAPVRFMYRATEAILAAAKLADNLVAVARKRAG